MNHVVLYKTLPDELYAHVKSQFQASHEWDSYTETPNRRGIRVKNVAILRYLDTGLKEKLCDALNMDTNTVRLRDAHYCADDPGFSIDWHFDEVERKAISCILYVSTTGSGTTIIDNVREMRIREIMPFENKAFAFVPEVGRSFHCVKRTNTQRQTVQIFYEKET